MLVIDGEAIALVQILKTYFAEGPKALDLKRLDLRRVYIDIVDNKSPYTLPNPTTTTPQIFLNGFEGNPI